MTDPAWRTQITAILSVYLEGLHDLDNGQLYNELRARRDTDKLKDDLVALLATVQAETEKHWKANMREAVALAAKDARIDELNNLKVNRQGMISSKSVSRRMEELRDGK